MPEHIRTRGDRGHACPRLCAFSGLILWCVGANAALAQEPVGESAVSGFFGAIDRHEIVGLALTLGAIAFAVVTAVMLVRTRMRANRADMEARAAIGSLRMQVERAAGLLCADPQVLVMWDALDGAPEILGDLAIIGCGPDPLSALDFVSWLPTDQARSLTVSLAALRSRGESFNLALTTLGDHYLEAEGRALGGRAVLRLKEVSGARRALAEMDHAHRELLAAFDPLRTLLQALSSPVWVRNVEGRLIWINPAYARAVEAASVMAALESQADLLERAAREDLDRPRIAGSRYAARLPVIVAGQRRLLDILDLPTSEGSAGIGIDMSDVETMRTELSRMAEAHRRTLDQISTPVAIFSAEQRLAFSNAAYQALWDLDATFLAQKPTDATILDRLRAARKLPEQADFRTWRTQLHEAYRAAEPRQYWWYLPDGRTLRVVTTPNPEGGITYVFEDVTERLDLERRYDALIRMQGETLDHLGEAVAVFGSDGRLRLSNPAFARMWKPSAAFLTEHPHIEAVIAACRPLRDDSEFWDRLRSAITGLERRDPVFGRVERDDGCVVDGATVPLPDGGTLVTFQDVTDSVNVERALRERNDALEIADGLKNDFVHHVSYELRTPLTNIIGFTHLLDDSATGSLNEKQREYLGYISSSSSALLAIITDILDLASIDAGAMQLDLGPVDIRRTITAAAEGVLDRLAEQDLTLDIRADADVGSFTADERRIRQILFNLLSNAIAFSLPGGTITLAAEREPEGVVLSVVDRGRGIPGEIVDRVFHRFETHALGSQHRGAGLGLSIVRSFVELHGGIVRLTSQEGRGTTVVCVFPVGNAMKQDAAA